jgi:hypothetical protein
MTNNQKIHQLLTIAANLTIVGLLISKAWNGNDKAIILVIFLYPTLIFVNSIIWLTLSSKRKTESKIYRLTTIGLLILFLPVLIIASMY